MSLPFNEIYRARHATVKKDLAELGIPSSGNLDTDRKLLKRAQITIVGGGNVYSWSDLDDIENPSSLLTLSENGRLLGTMTVATIREHYGIDSPVEEVLELDYQI